jgi:hypothetical protein
LLLQELLRQSGKRPKDLAVALEQHPSSITKHMNSAAFDDRMWRSVRRGLVALGINPALIRPEDEASRHDTSAVRDLSPLAAAFNDQQLANVKEILLADNASREALIVYYIDKRIAAAQPELSPEMLLQQKKDAILKAAMEEIASLSMLTANPLPPGRPQLRGESSADQTSAQTHARQQRKPANGR